MFLLMQPLLRPCCCRRGLQRIHLIQRRTFYLKESHYAWTTPVPHNARYPRDTNAVYELPSGVNTFNPNHLASAQYFDISESPLRTLYRRFAKHMMDAHSRQWGEQVPTRNTPFPPGSKGFLYFHSPPKDSPLVGNVRFRLAEQPDKEGFAAGHDLLLAHGLPWKLPLLEVVNTLPYIHFLRVLTGDGFVPPMLKLACESANTSRDSVFISSFGEPWVVNWATEYSRIYITRPEIHPLPILVHHPWYRRRLNSSTAPAAFAGRGIVSMVKMPDDKLGLRIEKILVLDRHSVKRNAIEPVEGLITELGFHMIQASTKLSFDRRLESGEYVMPTLKRLSEFEPNADPFKIYRHEARRPRPPAVPLPPLEVGHKDAPRRAQLQHAFAPASTPAPAPLPPLAPRIPLIVRHREALRRKAELEGTLAPPAPKPTPTPPAPAPTRIPLEVRHREELRRRAQLRDVPPAPRAYPPTTQLWAPEDHNRPLPLPDPYVTVPSPEPVKRDSSRQSWEPPPHPATESSPAWARPWNSSVPLPNHRPGRPW